MTFDRFLNRIHLSGLYRIIAAVVAVCLLLIAYLVAFRVRLSNDEQLYTNFINAYNAGDAEPYLSTDTYKALLNKPSQESSELVLSALVQAAQSQAHFILPDDMDVSKYSEPLSVKCEIYSASEILPLLYKELNSDVSSLKDAIIDMRKEPASYEAYSKLREVWKVWLQKAKLSKKTAAIQLQTATINNLLPGLAKSVVVIQPSDLAIMSGDLMKTLQAEGKRLIDLIEKDETVKPQPTETEIEPTNSNVDATASLQTTASEPKETIKQTANQTVQPTKSNESASGHTQKTPQTTEAKSSFKPHLENNSLPQKNIAKPKANSSVPTIGKYYQVKKSDNIYDLAEQAYADKYSDFEDDPDKYIDLIIAANKLPVRRNVVYLREQQVIYIPSV